MYIYLLTYLLTYMASKLSTTAVSTECGNQADHEDRSASTHHTKWIALAGIGRRVNFSLATLMFKTLHSWTLPYLSGEWQLVPDVNCWESTHANDNRIRSLRLSLACVESSRGPKLSQQGNSSFAMAGSRV